MGLPDACAALNASAENGTAVLLAEAGTSGAAIARIPAKAPAINARFKNLRVKIIVSSVVGLACGVSRSVTPQTVAMLPAHARREAGFPPRRLDFLLQKAVRLPADISRTRIGPGPAFIVGRARCLADFVALAPLELETAV